MTKQLTFEQRWLLFHMGGWQIVDALCSEDGVKKMMQSCWGSTGGKADNLPQAPEWLNRCGWEIRSGTIHSRGHNVPDITINASAINRFAAQLPDEIKAQLKACRSAGTANAIEQSRHCYCGHPERKHFEPDVICPPSTKQKNTVSAEYWRIRSWEQVLLAKALNLNGRSNSHSDQLDLFEVSA